MSYRRRFLPLIIFGILGLAIYLEAGREARNAADLARNCQSAAACAQTQSDFTNAILTGLLATILIAVGGFVSVLVGQQDRRRSAGAAPWPPQSGPPPQAAPPPDMTNYRQPGHPG